MQHIPATVTALVTSIAITAVGILPGCDAGTGNRITPGVTTDIQRVTATPPQTLDQPMLTAPTKNDDSHIFASEQNTSRFLTMATFGPTAKEVSGLTGSSASEWVKNQLTMPASLVAPLVSEYALLAGDAMEFDDEGFAIRHNASTFAFWRNAIGAQDQLRQRMAFALSQLLVVSTFGGEFLTDIPQPVEYYMDLLHTHAFGNYRELLEAVTYAPAMGYYLTYIGNQKADPLTGRMPDENYARELLQLFTVGLVALQPNGEPVLNAAGQPLELFDNNDITELAKVFTGLDLTGRDSNEYPLIDDFLEQHDPDFNTLTQPMAINENYHSKEAKTFLGCEIAAGTGASQSISQALDCIVAHANTGPFIARQLIQRFTTSAPSPDYVQRVAAAFDDGRYELPDGSMVGDGRKGDLSATITAILFDSEVRAENALTNDRFGKIREPILRFTHWARAFSVNASHPEYFYALWDTGEEGQLGQHPYRARSVFNFYRPGYVPPGTNAAAHNMTVPEMQIINASSIPAYINTMTYWVHGDFAESILMDDRDALAEDGVIVNNTVLRHAFVPDYREAYRVASDIDALLALLNRKLAYGSLSADTLSSIAIALRPLAVDETDDLELIHELVAFAVLLVMTSPDYLVQR